MVLDVKEVEPFALLFAEPFEGLSVVQEGHSYNRELQLRVWDTTREPVFRIFVQPDGTLIFPSTTNAFRTRARTSYVKNGVLARDYEWD